VRKPSFLVVVSIVSLLSLVACDGDGGGETGAASRVTGTTIADPTEDLFGRIPRIVRDVELSVVAVQTNAGEGSGVIWRAEGLVLTNHHVIAGARTVELAFADGKRAPAEIVASDPLTDLALLRSDRRDVPAVRFAEGLPVVGELAVAIGNPLGFENTVTAGIISGLHRSIPGSAPETQALIDLVQTDAAISPGNSGGALVNASGEVVGINVAYIPPQARAVSIGFAIPAPTVVDVATQLLEHGVVRHAFLGLQPAPLTPQVAALLGVDAENGVLVLEVVPGGPAATAGIRPGDVILTVGGKDINSLEEFLAELRRHNPGDRLEVNLVRDAQRLTVVATLTERARP
jgi:serine protease DegQ